MQAEGSPDPGRRRERSLSDPRGNLLGRSFPRGNWGQPAERLDVLYERAEEEALRTVEWYLAARAGKRRMARALRWGTVLGVVCGAALALLELAKLGGEGTGSWGLLALLGAAVCLGCDRYLGVTSGWMRNIATAQAVQRRVEALRYEWTVESARDALGPTEGTAGERVERRLDLLRRFSADVTELVRAETAEWMIAFRSGPPAPPLVRAAEAAEAGPRGERYEPRQPRFAPPLGTRPTMPRQRPPEPPPR